MKRDGRPIVAVVMYDAQMAQIADRAGVDIVSAGDSGGVALWGHTNESELTLDQMMLACQAVRRGVTRALVSCDLPLSVLRESGDAARHAATRLARNGGADVVKVHPRSISSAALSDAGVPVWAQLVSAVGSEAARTIDDLVHEAQALEAAGAVVLDFRYSGSIDGRVRSMAAAVGYPASSVNDGANRYANVAATVLSAIGELCEDVRAARPLRGE
jgi:3-methyl-2-oxobutanoate hydroxymethyltransferase